MLSYFPKAKAALDIRTIDFPRPRPEIVALLGEDNQGCPCLIPADPTMAKGLPTRSHEGITFIDDHRAILEYLARNHGTSRPSHD